MLKKAQKPKKLKRISDKDVFHSSSTPPSSTTLTPIAEHEIFEM